MTTFTHDAELIQQVVDHIENHLALKQADALSVAYLAQQVGVSPWHFQRLFKTWVGETLGNYIRGRRLSAAAERLKQGSDGIIDIAFAVGFNSHEAFTRSFKSQYGLSPKQFRQQAPRVDFKQKPVLSQPLYQHLSEEIQRQPDIVTRPALTLVGFKTRIPSPFLVEGSYCHLLENSWRQLFTHLDQLAGHTPNTMMGITISDSGRFDEAELDYMAAVAFDESSVLPALSQGMSRYSLPEQTIARFSVASVDIDTVGKTMDYIYGYWLPDSGYQRANGDDYELFEDVTEMDFSDIKASYVVPVSALSGSS